MKPYRVGILGGMGPLAGVELHRLLIAASPARSDQDHLQVVLFTNPQIPDRTISLKADDGREFARAAGSSARLLEAAGVDVIAMACITAHSRLAVIQQAVGVPILDGAALTTSHIKNRYARRPVIILATQGTINSRIFHEDQSAAHWIIPAASVQRTINQAISAIKAGHRSSGITKLLVAMDELDSIPEAIFLLGCTELGLLHDELDRCGFTLIDPLRIMAAELLRPRPFSPS